METYTKSPKRIFEAEFPRTAQRSVALAQRRKALALSKYDEKSS